MRIEEDFAGKLEIPKDALTAYTPCVRGIIFRINTRLFGHVNAQHHHQHQAQRQEVGKSGHHLGHNKFETLARKLVDHFDGINRVAVTIRQAGGFAEMIHRYAAKHPRKQQSDSLENGEKDYSL
jgi:hypothetical protein